MGVDSNILFTLKTKPDKEKMEKAAVFFRDKSNYFDGGVFLELGEEENYYNLDPKNEYEVIYECESAARYYGVGYERGYYPEIFLLAELLECYFKDYGIEVFYGSDLSEDISIFDREKRFSLLAHYCINENRPYHKG